MKLAVNKKAITNEKYISSSTNHKDQLFQLTDETKQTRSRVSCRIRHIICQFGYDVPNQSLNWRKNPVFPSNHLGNEI